jgi:hypothetical protein
MATRITVFLLSVLVLFGCEKWADVFYPKEDVEFSKGYFDLFRERDFEAIEARVDPGLRNPQLRSELEKIAAVIPREEPVEIQVADARTVMGGGVIRVHVTLQYAYPERVFMPRRCRTPWSTSIDSRSREREFYTM